MELVQRQNRIIRDLAGLEARIESLERDAEFKEDVSAAISPVQTRVAAELRSLRMHRSVFRRAPPYYYSLPLESRARVLGCPVEQLCKSIVMENTYSKVDTCDDPTNSRFYLVVLQYVSELNAELLQTLVRELRPPETRIPRKGVKLRLAKEEDNLRLTGYAHNSVTPFCTPVRIPMILSRSVAALPFFWLGGGEGDLKLGVDTEEFIAGVKPYVMDCTRPKARGGQGQ